MEATNRLVVRLAFTTQVYVSEFSTTVVLDDHRLVEGNCL